MRVCLRRMLIKKRTCKQNLCLCNSLMRDKRNFLYSFYFCVFFAFCWFSNVSFGAINFTAFTGGWKKKNGNCPLHTCPYQCLRIHAPRSTDIGCLVNLYALFAWQFPHFACENTEISRSKSLTSCLAAYPAANPK